MCSYVDETQEFCPVWPLAYENQGNPLASMEEGASMITNAPKSQGSV